MSNETAVAMKIGTVAVPRNAKEIGTEYGGRTDIVELVLHSGIRNIQEGAFRGCTSLERFVLEEGGKYSLLQGCIYDGKTLVAYPPGLKDKEFEVPEETEKISDYAFNGNPYLKKIVIGDEVCSMTGRAFLGCKNLFSVRIGEYNDSFNTDGPIVFNGDSTELVYIPPMSKPKMLTLPEQERLGPACLADCRTLRILNLGDSLEDVAEDAFGESCRPKKLGIPDNVECRLPFKFAGKKGGNLAEKNIPGHMYRLYKDGVYRQIGEFDAIDFPMSEFEFERSEDEEPSFSPFGGIKFAPVKVTDASIDDIAGLEDVKTLIRNHIILPSRKPELFRTFDLNTSTGVLLYGPPGNGKTMLARAVAAELDADFFSVKPTDIHNCFVGESELRLKCLFETARKSERAVIFFDDFDSIGRARGNSLEPWQGDLIAELLIQMQGLEKHSGTLLVLAATNRPWELDSALLRPGRFGFQIHVGLPDAEARETIFRKRLAKIPCESIDCAYLADRTEGYNGADIEQVIDCAKMHRILEIGSGDGGEKMTLEDLEFALTQISSSVSKRDLRDIANYCRGEMMADGDETYVSRDQDVPGYN